MSALSETCLKIRLLFLAFVISLDFGGILGKVGFGIRVGDTDINNTIRSAGP
jgi:hypothetical protein